MVQTNCVQQVEQNFWTTAQVARYLNYEPNTLAVWRVNGQSDLQPVRIGRMVRYSSASVRSIVTKEFLKHGAIENIERYLKVPLWNTAQTATYLGYKTHTLPTWRSNKRHQLRPIQIGRSIRYCPIFIRDYAEREFMNPE